MAQFVLGRTRSKREDRARARAGSTALTEHAQPKRIHAIQQVLAYFVSRPLAVEGLEGIARWRLMSVEIARRVEETHDAIEWLVQHGFLERVDTRAAAPLFRLNAARAADAHALLAGLASGADEKVEH